MENKVDAKKQVRIAQNVSQRQRSSVYVCVFVSDESHRKGKVSERSALSDKQNKFEFDR